MYNFDTMIKVPNKNVKNFFLQANVLTNDEIDLIDSDCEYGITMPEAGVNKVIIYVITDKILPLSIYKKLSNTQNDKLEIIFQSSELCDDFTLIHDYIQDWIKTNYPGSYVIQEAFRKTNYQIKENNLIVKYVSNSELDELKQIEKSLIYYLTKVNFNINAITYELDSEKQGRILNEQAARQKEIAQMAKEAQKIEDLVSVYDRKYRVSGNFTPIADITKEIDGQFINISGEIIKCESRFAKKNKQYEIFEFTIYDYAKGAIKASLIWNHDLKFSQTNKYYQRKQLPYDYVKSFKVGDWISARCLVSVNNFSGSDPVCKISQMCHSSRPKHLIPHDDATKKRVELLLHSNMTAYDGLDTPQTIYQHAQACGYESVAIIERNNVQSIPSIFHTSHNYPSIKPIYGCEFEIIDKFIPIVVNPIDAKLFGTTYIIFDIETTGLYPQFDDLIEFGAIKYKDGAIIDRLDFFVKPTKPLTNVAINLSHITNDMVKDAIDQKSALLKIKKWIGNDVLIAHNGIKFDLNFLNKLCERFDVEPISNCLIDTLEISHAVNKKFSRHTLGHLVSKLKVEYNPLEAHRADKDSEYLLEVWKYFAKRIKEDYGITNVNQINDKLQNAPLRASRRGYAVDVYVKTQKGLQSLFKLLSLALTDQLYQKDDDEEVQQLTNGQPKLHFEDFEQYRQDLVICPHPYEGDVWDASLSDTHSSLEEKIKKYDYIFVAPAKNIEYLAKQDKLLQSDAIKALSNIINTSKTLNKKVCAVSDAYYLMKYEQQFHEIYVYTKQLGNKRHPLYRHDGTTFVPDLHCLTTNEMLDAFKFLDNDKIIKEIVIDNTQEFAHNVNLVIPIKEGPDVLCKPELPNAEQKLKDLVWSNAKRIYGDPLDKEIEDRINQELNGICSHGYAVIYWISHLLIEKSNKDGYLVGSRGSVGSSLVAFFSDISEVNPMWPHYVCPHCKHYEPYPDKNVDGFDLPPKKCPVCGHEMNRDGHNIPFASFLGFNADKTPDIDLNFSGEYQAKAHNFIRDMFGYEHAFRAGTIATVANKTAIGYVKSYFEQIDPESVPNNALIESMAKKCEGVKRTTGQHPGGIVVVPHGHDVTEFTAFNYPSNDKTKGWYTTHFEYHSIEQNLLKFDILGHDEPTILKHLHDTTKIDPRTIPNHDDKVLQLFANSKALGIVDPNYDKNKLATMALPEFGTPATRRIVAKTKPIGVGDLIRISGLSHGTGVWQGNAEDLVDNGAKLSQVAACRENIFEYLIDCGMDQTLAFKAVEFIRKNKHGLPIPDKFIQGMVNAKVPQWYIDSCKKIEYLFPKAHATAYVIDAIRTAWYKVYYPAQFYAVWFSIRSDVFDIETVVKGSQEVERVFKEYKAREKSRKAEDKLSNKQSDLIPIFEVCLEMFARGITILNIDINKSQATEFITLDDKTILPPFTSLDGLGKEVADSIVKARNEKPFSSIEDLKERTKMSKTLIDKLQALHVLDNLSPDDQMRLIF